MQTFHRGKKYLFCDTASLHSAIKHIRSMGTLMEEKGKTSEHLLLEMAFSAHCDSPCNLLLLVCCRYSLLQLGTDQPRHSPLQWAERSGFKTENHISCVYKACYLAPRELIPSFSYICCQTNKIF